MLFRSVALSVIKSPTVTGNLTICGIGTTSQLTGSDTPDPSIPWLSSKTGIATVSKTGLITAISNGSADISYFTNKGCSSHVTVTVTQQASISVTTAPACSPDNATWSMGVTVSSGAIVKSTAGTVAQNGNVWTISAVPAKTNITLNVADANGGCANSLDVKAPDCGCAVITSPVISGGDVEYCTGETILAINATVSAAGVVVDWYAAATGGTALKTASNSYLPTGAGTFYAEARNSVSGCTSARTAVVVTVSAITAPSVSIASSINPACSGDKVTFVATPTNGGTKPVYQWKVNGSNAGTNSETFSPASVGNGDVITCVMTSSSKCVTTATATSNAIKEVVYQTPVVGVIAGETIVCAPSQVSYTVPENSNITRYEWNLPVGASFVGDKAQRTITVAYSVDAAGGVLSVAGMNDQCGSAGSPTAESIITISQKPGDAGAIVGTNTFVRGSTDVIFSVDTIPNATDYIWTFSQPQGVTVHPSSTADTIKVDFGAAAVSGTLSVIGKNSCGEGAASPVKKLDIPEQSYNLYPNPSNGKFWATISFPTETVFNISIIDNLGNKIMEIPNATTVDGVYRYQIDLGSISNGVYFVQFHNASFTEVRKLIVNH